MRAVEFKINTQKSISYLYTSIRQLKNVTLKSLTFPIAIKNKSTQE